ncbi:hypothetical protein [Helicobacter monodelphidis]|uniref:hypothetical protein n=1 Tax=Helicobacter sp. 15-1451 TaxID=2004995 RepID=UPI0015EC8CBC|nr:hypothetical protein [Helicobacter sp. 15-1451]
MQQTDDDLEIYTINIDEDELDEISSSESEESHSEDSPIGVKWVNDRDSYTMELNSI